AQRGGLKKIPGARDLGKTSSSKMVTVSFWLRMHQPDAVAQKAQAVHDPSSGQYQQWSASAFSAANSPTASEAKTVSDFLRAQGFKVLGVGPNNLYVQATGTAAQVQSALKADLHDIQVGAQTLQANFAGPALPPNIQALVAHVGGLDELRAKPMNLRPIDPDGKYAPVRLSAAPHGLVFSAGCFRKPQTVQFTGGGVTASYSGNRYGQDI